jgi:hypothetical protein
MRGIAFAFSAGVEDNASDDKRADHTFSRKMACAGAARASGQANLAKLRITLRHRSPRAASADAPGRPPARGGTASERPGVNDRPATHAIQARNPGNAPTAQTRNGFR